MILIIIAEYTVVFPGSSAYRESAYNAERPCFNSWVRKIHSRNRARGWHSPELWAWGPLPGQCGDPRAVQERPPPHLSTCLPLTLVAQTTAPLLKAVLFNRCSEVAK